MGGSAKRGIGAAIAALWLAMMPAAGAEEADPAAREVLATVRQLAPTYRLDPALVAAMIQTESAFDRQAVSPRGARGLMQLMPDTAARFGVHDPSDVAQNLGGGMGYLRWLLDRFDGDRTLALAAYNAGEGAVLRHGGVPPFAETLDYIARVEKLYAGDDVDRIGRRPTRPARPIVYRSVPLQSSSWMPPARPTSERTASGVVVLRGIAVAR